MIRPCVCTEPLFLCCTPTDTSPTPRRLSKYPSLQAIRNSVVKTQQAQLSIIWSPKNKGDELGTASYDSTSFIFSYPTMTTVPTLKAPQPHLLPKLSQPCQ